jgi:putative endopeptidase
MNKSILAALALVSLIGCEREQAVQAPAAQSEPEQAASLQSGINLEYMDTSVRPGDDFFSYVNGSWYAETEIPADKSSIDSFSVLRDQSEEDVRTIIEASAGGDFAQGSDEQKVGDLYNSFLDMQTRNARGLKPLAPEWARIDAISSHDELAVYLAAANKRGYNTPFALNQYVDFKNPDTYMMYTWQGGLGLPDREFYFNEDDKSVEIREKYLAYIENMLALGGLPGEANEAAMIMALETRMAAEHMLKEETRDWVKLYNKYPLNELNDLMPRFNWQGYINEAGIENIDGLVVTMVDHMQALDGIIADTSIEDWQTWLKWMTLNRVARRLNAELELERFEFYGKVLGGREELQPAWRRGVNTVNATLGEVVGKVYVKEHFSPQAKARMLELVDNLTGAYEKSIKELDWMTDATRTEALDKLSKFTSKIGYPDEWRDYIALNAEMAQNSSQITERKEALVGCGKRQA